MEDASDASLEASPPQGELGSIPSVGLSRLTVAPSLTTSAGGTSQSGTLAAKGERCDCRRHRRCTELY